MRQEKGSLSLIRSNWAAVMLEMAAGLQMGGEDLTFSGFCPQPWINRANAESSKGGQSHETGFSPFDRDLRDLDAGCGALNGSAPGQHDMIEIGG